MPVQFLLPWDDEHVERQSALALFDAFAPRRSGGDEVALTLLSFRGHDVVMRSPVVHLSPDDLTPAVADQLARRLAASTTVSVGGLTVSLSAEARGARGQILALVASGTAVEVKPLTAWLTTSEAAAILHVSRPTLVHMLESGLIPYDQPGVHRRISRAAIDAFLAGRAEQRRTALDTLAAAEDPSVADEFVATR